ncbi:glycerophosphodiester phosphodiesterase family protein [Xanthobacter tagetidis]|uniref:Glycerophosphodiester phosphodiesterase n=1 Tax=Xanthobacter tagetidis TaxID=60216 RepID=A0A3L7ABW6_9HYPH|nr:glycerophosphodiester phosphodiesterase family protein [Xanthobacter tagetidis]MBB6309665.1 glycerophosphoryl diester phosphodiesterase [Xanthobacter tagetidis]RLP77208.1 glycerophosphodiester phosphodiesterase [Xanthobacter tagetidis]
MKHRSGDPGFVTARPVAHRGLHDAARGIIENMPAAIDAALAGGFAIEVDLQASADGEAMVFHDFTLDRLTQRSGPVGALTAAALAQVPFKATADRMMRLSDLLDRVAGRVPLLIEIKSDFSGDTRLAAHAAQVVAAYDGPAALMSFDPAQVETVRMAAPAVPRGIVAEHRYDHPDWSALPARARFCLGNLLHWPRSRFQFVAYRVADLDALAPRLARRLGPPLLAWTVRTPQDRAQAQHRADQMIFEGFVP